MARFKTSGLFRRAGFATALLLSLLLLAACGTEKEVSLVTPTPVDFGVGLPVPTSTPAVVTGSIQTAPAPTFTPLPPDEMPTLTSLPVALPPTATPSIRLSVPATTPAPATPTRKISQGEIAPFSAEAAYGQVKVLADTIGPRPAGSDNAKKAADYIAGQFEAFGLKTATQEKPFNWQRDKDSSLTINGEGNGEIFKVRLAYVEANSPKQLEGEVFYLDNTAPELLLVMSGKIVLVNETYPKLNQLMQDVTGAAPADRPLAVLMIPGQENPSMSPILRNAPVNVGLLDKAAGERLAQRAAQGNLIVKLSLNWEVANVNLRNVTGTRAAAGGDKAAPIVLIGSHYDSSAEGPGANDNASGTGIMLELAHSLVKAYPEVELRFVAFDGEELGMAGSQDYVAGLSRDERSRLVAMFNLDMVAAGNRLSVYGTATLANLAKPVISAQGYTDVDVTVSNEGGGTDAASFANANIPFLSLVRPGDSNMHRSSDTSANFTSRPLDEAGQITLGSLQRLLLGI